MTHSKSGLIDMTPDPYRGLNPAFVRKVWAKRRKELGTRPVRVPVPHKGVTKPWTAPEQAQLRQFLSDGLTYDEIAYRLGRSRSSVSGFVKRMRAEHRPVEETR